MIFPLKELEDAVKDVENKPESRMRLMHLEAMLFESLMAVQDKIQTWEEDHETEG